MKIVHKAVLLMMELNAVCVCGVGGIQCSVCGDDGT